MGKLKEDLAGAEARAHDLDILRSAFGHAPQALRGWTLTRELPSDAMHDVLTVHGRDELMANKQAAAVLGSCAYVLDGWMCAAVLRRDRPVPQGLSSNHWTHDARSWTVSTARRCRRCARCVRACVCVIMAPLCWRACAHGRCLRWRGVSEC